MKSDAECMQEFMRLRCGYCGRRLAEVPGACYYSPGAGKVACSDHWPSYLDAVPLWRDWDGRWPWERRQAEAAQRS